MAGDRKTRFVYGIARPPRRSNQVLPGSSGVLTQDEVEGGVSVPRGEERFEASRTSTRLGLMRTGKAEARAFAAMECDRRSSSLAL